jgi:hypothetical protein
MSAQLRHSLSLRTRSAKRWHSAAFARYSSSVRMTWTPLCWLRSYSNNRPGRAFPRSWQDLAGLAQASQRLVAEMRPFPAEPMRMWPISTRVNKPENDDPSIVEPIELAIPPPKLDSRRTALVAEHEALRRSSSVVFSQAQDIGDDIFEIVTLDHDIWHVAMRGLQHDGR